MFSNIDTLHSYDPLAILRVIYNLIAGTKAGVIATTTSPTFGALGSFFASLPYHLINIFARFAVFSFFFSIAMAIVAVIYFIKMKKLRDSIIGRVAMHDVEENTASKGIMENPKWKLVQEHINSQDANKWKLAVLEADIILNDLLDAIHLPGETMGDKLKAVEASDFTHIEEAWEAHKIRNAIAHQGSDFLLNEREAKRVIGLYQKVFEEFEII